MQGQSVFSASWRRTQVKPLYVRQRQNTSVDKHEIYGQGIVIQDQVKRNDKELRL